MQHIRDYAIKHGARKTARRLIDQRLVQLYGMGINDLPDGPEMCSFVDELEELIEEGLRTGTFDNKSMAAVINEAASEDTIGNAIFS